MNIFLHNFLNYIKQYLTFILGGGLSFGVNFILTFIFNGTQKVRFGGEWTTSGWNHLSADYTVPTNSWTHIAASWSGDGDVMRIYINGQLATSSGSINGAFVDESIGTYVGRHSAEDNNYFDGKIDDVRIWNFARTEMEIADDMYRELNGNEDGLMAYWKLNNSISDFSSQGNNLTNTGSTSFVTDTPFVGFVESLVVRKSSNELVTNSIVLQNDDEIQLSLAANKTYIIDGVIFASSTSATPDIVIAFFGQTDSEVMIGYTNDVNEMVLDSGDVSNRIQLPGNTPTSIHIKGTVVTGTTSGDFQLKWAQATSNANPTAVMEGSYLRAEEI